MDFASNKDNTIFQADELREQIGLLEMHSWKKLLQVLQTEEVVDGFSSEDDEDDQGDQDEDSNAEETEN